MATVIAILLFFQAAEDLYRRGLLLLRQNDAAGAAPLFEQAVVQQPSAPLIWMALADARLRLQQFEEASAAEAKAVRLGAQDPVVRKVRSMFHARFAHVAPNAKDASEHWKQALALDPQSERYRLEYIQFLLDHRAEREAEAEAFASLKLFPSNSELHRLLGLALYSQGRNAEAIDAFLAAIDLAPGNESYYASLETLLPSAGAKLPAIVSRLRKFVDATPKSPLGPYLLALTVPEERQSLLEKAVQIDPDFWPAYFELHRGTKDPAEQIRLLEKVVQLNPEYAPAYYGLAQAYAKVGRREEAKKAREKHHSMVQQPN